MFGYTIFIAVTLMSVALASTSPLFRSSSQAPSIVRNKGAFDEVVVTLQVYSSELNPQWTLTGEEAANVRSLITNKNNPSGLYHIMGYVGFEINNNVIVRNNMEAEMYLLTTVPQGLINDDVYDHILKRILNQHADIARHYSFPAVHYSGPRTDCDDVVGPDSVPSYDPETDDSGCFLARAGDNNCYNSGNDIVTKYVYALFDLM